MKRFTISDIKKMEKVRRLNLINSVSGYKAANLIGSRGSQGENLAIFSSVVHLGANPPLQGLVMRPARVERHSLSNIKESGYYTINHINEKLVERAHFTSANFPAEVSEFEACQIEAEYLGDFTAPFVKESKVKMGMKLVEIHHIKANDTLFIVGEIEQLLIEEGCMEENGQLNLNANATVCISGLNRYHQVKEIAKFPYARMKELPDF